MITHIVGGGFGVLALVLGLVRTVPGAAPLPILGVLIYGLSLIALYTVSSVYHGLRPGMGKKVMQVIDHCTIYALIAGTYTPVLISAFLPQNPTLGWSLLALEWILAAIACTLTAIDLRKFRVFSMICYIGMGLGHPPLLAPNRPVYRHPRLRAPASGWHLLHGRRHPLRHRLQTPLVSQAYSTSSWFWEAFLQFLSIFFYVL